MSELTVRLARPEDLPAAFALRHEVFVLGQGVPEDVERDDLDATADHAVALRDGAVVGTGRLLDRGGGLAAVGRMAVAEAARRTGVGAALLRLLEDRAAARGMTAVELHAQLHAAGFYERLGYTAVSDVYLEAGIEHVSMRRALVTFARPPAGH